MISTKVEKKDIETVIDFLEKGEKVYVLLAPTVEKTLGNSIQKKMFYKALSDAGFFAWCQIVEEADQLVLQEVEEWESLELNRKIIVSSSCPAIVRMVEKEYSDLSSYLSRTKSPMHLASVKVKKEDPSVKTVFIGPCYWKKEEQKQQRNEIGCVDVVLTFEEYVRVLKELNIDLEWEYTAVNKEIIQGENIDVPGRLAICVKEKMKAMNMKSIPQFLIGAGIDECKRILKGIQKGEYQNCYVELLACGEGCGVKE